MTQRRILAILFGTLLLDTIGFGMVLPIIPIIFTDPNSASFVLEGHSKSVQFFVAGAVTAIFGLMQFIASPILGELSDVYGRRKLLMLGVAVLAISQVLFGVGITAASLVLLFTSRAIAGLAGANFSIVQAAIADITPVEDRAKNFGLIGAAFGMGFIIGPLLSGWVAGLMQNPAAPFWLAGLLGIANVLYIYYFLPETRRTKEEAHTFTLTKGIENIQEALNDKEARPAYLASFLYMSGFAFFTTFLGILLVSYFSFNEAQVGTYFAVIGVWVVFTQTVILRYVSARYSDMETLRYSILIVAGAIIFHPFMPNEIALYILLPVLAIPQGLTFAMLASLVSRSVSAERQGAALGINSSLMALAQGIIPLVAGIGSGIVGIGTPFVVGGAIVIGAWMVLFFKPD